MDSKSYCKWCIVLIVEFQMHKILWRTVFFFFFFILTRAALARVAHRCRKNVCKSVFGRLKTQSNHRSAGCFCFDAFLLFSYYYYYELQWLAVVHDYFIFFSFSVVFCWLNGAVRQFIFTPIPIIWQVITVKMHWRLLFRHAGMYFCCFWYQF